MKKILLQQLHQNIWDQIVEKYEINQDQEAMFAKYMQLLLSENEKYNITAITDVGSLLWDHFADSLAILKAYDMQAVHSLLDVGTGGGFPGIPLAIMLANVEVSLIEVNLKKVHFLNLVIQNLGLKNVKIYSDDWRTFLRISQDPVDLVVARASLPISELLRMFKPSSPLKNGTFVYWASKKWIPTEQEKEYLVECVEYAVGQKQRNLCFFKNQ